MTSDMYGPYTNIDVSLPKSWVDALMKDQETPGMTASQKLVTLAYYRINHVSAREEDRREKAREVFSR